MRNEGGLGSELRGDEEMRVHGGAWGQVWATGTGVGGGGWLGMSWPGTG